MTDEVKELIERLGVTRHDVDLPPDVTDEIDAAHKALTRLSEQNAAKDARIAELEGALKDLCFYGMEVMGVKDADKTQAIWEIVYRDRFSDWVDFEDLRKARAALSESP